MYSPFTRTTNQNEKRNNLKKQMKNPNAKKLQLTKVKTEWEQGASTNIQQKNKKDRYGT